MIYSIKTKLYKLIKAIIDILFSIILIIFLFPLFILIYFHILIKDGVNPIFIQKRIGKNNKLFKMFKFRTLTNDAPKDLATNEFKDIMFYYTKTGSYLRKTSLDELPQIINVLFGHMSFIGPRPLLWNQFNLIKKRELDKSNTVKPGISGLAQIAKPAENNDVEKLNLDKIYCDNFSLKQDIKILIKTILFVFHRFIN